MKTALAIIAIIAAAILLALTDDPAPAGAATLQCEAQDGMGI